MRQGFVPKQVRAMLQESAVIALDDYFEFLVGEAREELDGASEGGGRYPVEARMDGWEFARFHVDVGVGDEVLEPLDIVTGEDWLRFAGDAASSFPVISSEQQFAEKLHAYTLPRGEGVNTRTKASSIWCCSSATGNSISAEPWWRFGRRSRDVRATNFHATFRALRRNGNRCLTRWQRNSGLRWILEKDSKC